MAGSRMAYCCEKMKRWSQPQEKYGTVIHHTGLRLLCGINIDDGKGFISIAYCPWCGVKVSEVEESLIGRPMAEGRL
jgi:hypothetical protein